MSTLFNEVLYRPIFNALIFLYELTGDLGIAIILITIFIKILLYPLSKKQLESQQKIKKLQPKIEKIKEENPDDKEAQSRALMNLYKEEKVNPASGCLPLLIQLPILIALYRVFMPGKALLINNGDLIVVKEMLYSISYLQNVDVVNKMFLGFIDLTQRSVFLAAISSGLQFIQSKSMLAGQAKKKKKASKKSSKEPDFQEIFSSQMTYLMPVMTFFFGISFPAGLPLYWSISTIITIIQQKYTNKFLSKTKAAHSTKNA